MTEFNMSRYIDDAFDTLQSVAQTYIYSWGYDRIAEWSFDMNDGMIHFITEDNLHVSAPAQIVGTYNSKDSTFLWSWANSSIPPALQECALKVKSFGEEHHYKDFTTPKIECDELECWKFTAVAGLQSDMPGAYRGPAGEDVFVFFTFGTVIIGNKTN